MTDADRNNHARRLACGIVSSFVQRAKAGYKREMNRHPVAYNGGTLVVDTAARAEARRQKHKKG